MEKIINLNYILQFIIYNLIKIKYINNHHYSFVLSNNILLNLIFSFLMNKL